MASNPPRFPRNVAMRQLTIRIPDTFYLPLEAEAQRLKTSPTALAREYMADAMRDAGIGPEAPRDGHGNPMTDDWDDD